MFEQLKIKIGEVASQIPDEAKDIRQRILNLRDSMSPEQHQEVRRTITHLLSLVPTTTPWVAAAKAVWATADSIATAVEENRPLPPGVTSESNVPPVKGVTTEDNVADLHENF